MILTLFAAGWLQPLAGFLMFFGSLFLILLVLVQRGRGGGLSGAFGGAGGQSAFGTKAGDTFTRITIVSATIWILLCMTAVRFLGNTNPNASILTSGTEAGADPLSLDLGGGPEGDPGVSDNGIGSLLDAATEGAVPGESPTDGAAGGGEDSPATSDAGSDGEPAAEAADN